MSLAFVHRRLSSRAFKQIIVNVRVKTYGYYRCFSNITEPRSENVVKSYADIISEAQIRKSQLFARRHPKPLNLNLDQFKIKEESSKLIVPGDLIISGSSIQLVLRVPHKCYDEYLVTDLSGKIFEIHLSAIKARLLSYVSPDLFDFSAAELARQCHLPTKCDNDELTSYPKSIIGKHIDLALYKAYCKNIRVFHNDIDNLANSIFEEVSTQVNRLQQDNKHTCISFTEFVGQFVGKSTSEVTALDFCAVNQCLSSNSLRFKVRRNISYMTMDQLIILSKEKETKTISALFAPKIDEEFLRDYACGNLPSGVPVSTAIMELRRQFPKLEQIDPQVCAESFKFKDCAMWDKLEFKWLYGQAEARLPQISLNKGNDKMAALRESFDEPVYSIDSAGTRCIEDGLSLKDLGKSSVQLGVHTSDPAAFMDIHGSMQQLVSGFYYNGKACRMLPVEFENFLSLRSGPRPSLSLFADINLETGDINNVVLKPLTLTNIQNFEFEDVDVNADTFSKFHKVAEFLHFKRLKNGAFSISSHIDDEEKIDLNDNTNSPGSKIVSEMMILANNLAGSYCFENKIPIFYRNQRLLLPSPQIKNEFQTEWEALNGSIPLKWRKVFSSNFLSPNPEPFRSMGIDVNARFASPLRLWDNLIVHSQLEAHLLGAELPFTAKQLVEMQDFAQLMDSAVRRLTREYYYGKRVDQLKPGATVEGVVIDSESVEAGKSVLVFLPRSKLNALYVGSKELKMESSHKFVVSNVMQYGKKVELKLTNEI